jgi:hypothetical protein
MVIQATYQMVGCPKASCITKPDGHVRHKTTDSRCCKIVLQFPGGGLTLSHCLWVSQEGMHRMQQ